MAKLGLKDAIGKYKEQGLTYYNGLSERDQKAVQLLGVFVAASLFFVMIWTPLHDWKDDALREATSDYKDFAWLTDNQLLIATQIASSDGEGAVNSASILESVNKAATTYNLTIANFNAESEQLLRISFLNSNFNQIVQFSHMIEHNFRLTISDMTVTKLNESGVVNAQFTISDGY